MASLTITLDEEGARARYFVSGTDVFVLGHYPGNPIFPGVLVLDMLTELAEALAARTLGPGSSATLIKRVQYLKATVPGDVLELAVVQKGRADEVLTLTATATIGGTVSTRATIECRALALAESAHA
ncbi:MAG: 3-hydroxyacyl-ACP dehydratase FabZ family protein [Gammaproteobacteria bacterium]